MLMGMLLNITFGVLRLLWMVDVANRIRDAYLGEYTTMSAISNLSYTVVLWILAYRRMVWAKVAIGVIFSIRLVIRIVALAGAVLELHTGQIKRLNGHVVALWVAEIILIVWSLWLVGFSKSVSAYFRNRSHHST